MLTNISTKTIRYSQIHRVINNLPLCMLLKKSVSFIRFETQGIRNRVNVPRLKTNRSTDRKTHIFGRKNLGCYMSSPPAPAGGIGLKPSETGSRWKSSKTWVIETKIIKAESKRKKDDPHRTDSQRPLLSMAGGVGVWGTPIFSYVTLPILINFYQVNETRQRCRKRNNRPKLFFGR